MPLCVLGPSRQRSGVNYDPARKLTDMGSVPCLTPLHESTSPEAIAADQRDAVREAVARLGREDISTLSEAVFLHPWIVRRRLAEILGHKPPEREKTPVKLSKIDDVVAILRKGPLTARQISVAAGVHVQTVHWYASNHKHLFRVVRNDPLGNGKTVKVWGLVEQQPQKGKVRT